MSLFSKYVSLKKGAYLIIEHTEALHVVDVNSGNRAKVDNDQERTAMDVNLAAAAEIARPPPAPGHRRDHRNRLHRPAQEQPHGAGRENARAACPGDRAKHTDLPLSKFGLMQITRQRVRPKRTSTSGTLHLHGTGKVAPAVLLDDQIAESPISSRRKTNAASICACARS